MELREKIAEKIEQFYEPQLHLIDTLRLSDQIISEFKQAGYRQVPELPVLSDEGIRRAIEPIYRDESPQRFNRDGTTTWAFQIADAVILAQLDDVKRQLSHE